MRKLWKFKDSWKERILIGFSSFVWGRFNGGGVGEENRFPPHRIATETHFAGKRDTLIDGPLVV